MGNTRVFVCIDRNYVKGLLTLFALMMFLFASSCGQDSSINNYGSTSGRIDVDPSIGPHTNGKALEIVVTEVKNYPTPDYVDKSTFDLLREELVRQLEACGKDRLTSTTSPSSCRVETLATVGRDGGSQILWEAHLDGDTDCDGEVTVADITPIAQRYLNRADDGIEDGYDEVVDADRDEEIGIADITPIAQNFLARIDGYNVYRREAPTGSFELLGSTGFKTPSQTDANVDVYEYSGRANVFVFTDPAPGGDTSDWYYEVRPVSGTDEITDDSEIEIYYEPGNQLMSPDKDASNIESVDRDDEIGLLKDQLIMNFEDATTLEQMINAVYSTGIGAHIAGILSNGDGLQLQTITDVGLLAADIAVLGEQTAVADVQNNYLIPAPDLERTPSKANPEPAAAQQWNLEALNAEPGWDYGLDGGAATGGEGALIAFIDTGIDSPEFTFTNNVSSQSIYIDGKQNRAGDPSNSGTLTDDYGHGTAVAGVAAAPQNGVGISGVAYNADILAVKVGFRADDGKWYIPASSIAEGIYYAVAHNASVIHLPIAVTTDPGAVIHRAIQFAVANNIPVVCPAGDYNADADLYFPASYAESLTVGATDVTNAKASFSNHGSCVALAAPGADIYSTNNTDGYETYSRTTMASAQVAGVVAMIRAIDPSLTPDDIHNLLTANSTPLSPVLGLGAGIANLGGTMPEVPGAVVPTSEWHIETVDSGLEVGWYNCITIDANDNPHVCYMDSPAADTKYAYNDGSTWQTEVVDGPENVGDAPSIAIDSQGTPHISYLVWVTRDLRYAFYDGTQWQIQTVEAGGGGGSYTSIAIDLSDNPHISYWDSANNDLKYASYDGTNWQTEIVDSNGDVGSYGDLAIGSNDKPQISYYDSANGALKYATFNGTVWDLQTVDSTNNVGSYTSIALDATNNPHISYFYSTQFDLKYALFDGTDWQIETVDSADGVGESTSIDIDSLGRPHIGYYDLSNADVKYAFYDGSAWQITAVESLGTFGWSTSLALDSKDRPHICYTDSTSGAILKYAWFG